MIPSDPRSPALLDALAQFTHDLTLSATPLEVRRQAALCLLDTIGCMLAGAHTDEGAAVLAAERDIGAGGPPARLLGSHETLPAEAAARVHGYWGDIFELNDLIGGHASIGNVAAALALAGACGATGAQLLAATIAGIEVTSRVYTAVYGTLKPYTEVAMVTPGLVGAFGTAAVAASLQGMSRQATREALAIAGALTTWCPAETIFGSGGSVKPMMFGAWPAAAGLRGAAYARHGLTGPERLLESPLGLMATLARAPDARAITDPQRWFLAEPRRKLHACCGYTHAAVDLAATLRARLGAQALTHAHIRVGMPAYVLPAVSKREPPVTPNDARFHVGWCVALAAAGEDVILPAHSVEFETHLRRPDIRALLPNIEIVEDVSLTHYHQCVMTVTRAGAPAVVARLDAPRGTPRNPLSDAEVIAKFQRLAAGHLDAQASAAYAARVLDLEGQTSIDWIFDQLVAA